MTDTILAGHEDHAGWGESGGVDGVMACAGYYVHAAVAQGGGGFAYGVDAVWVAWWVAGYALYTDVQATVLAGFIDEGKDFIVHDVEQFGGHIAQVYVEFGFAGDEVAAVGEDHNL